MAGPVKAWDANGNPIASQPSQAWDAQGNPVSSTAPNAGLAAPKPPTVAPDNRSALERFAEEPNPIPLDSYTNATLHGLRNIAQGAAQGVQGGLNLVKTAAKAWNDPKADVGDALLPNPHFEQVPGAIKDINASADPLGSYARAASDTAGQSAGQALGALATEGAMKAAPKILSNVARGAEAPADLVHDTYSKTGDHLSSALRSNTKVDVPAEAKIAAPAIEEGLNDRGINTKSFKGRNGPTALQAGIDNALDIHEARAKAMIDPIRGEAVDPQVLAKNPELAARFADHKRPITYGDLDAMRIQLNKELRMGNFYSKPPSAQYAIQDPLASVHQAANQARDMVYGKVGETTGLDIAPVKRTESALIKLGDLAETTKNTLSPKEAQFNSTGPLKRLQGSIQGALSVKANPVNAFSIPEKTGLFNPLNEFNSHMQKAFPSLKAAAADRTVSFPKYNLQLTPPSGSLPGPVQQILKLSGGEHVPGPQLQLTSPGSMPPDVQRPFSFMEGQNPNQSGSVAPGGAGTAPIPKTPAPEPVLELTSPGQMPPEAQRPFSFMEEPNSNKSGPVAPGGEGSAPKRGGGNAPKKSSGTVPKQFSWREGLQQILDASKKEPANVPRSLGAAAATPAAEEVPGILRGPAGLERRATSRMAPLSATELEAAIKQRKPVQTPFDVTEGAMNTINNDPAMQKIAEQFRQGGHAGGGVASIEELNRPGTNYVVSKHGKLTFHGKAFAPENTPEGAAHVTVLPDKTIRVNAGNLTPAMERAIENGIKK